MNIKTSNLIKSELKLLSSKDTFSVLRSTVNPFNLAANNVGVLGHFAI